MRVGHSYGSSRSLLRLSGRCQYEWGDKERWAYEVSHHGASIHECSSSVRPLCAINEAALCLAHCARYSVKDFVVITNKTNRACPVIAFGSPVGICLVSRVPGQAGSELEECSVRYSILVVISWLEGENLRTQASTAV